MSGRDALSVRGAVRRLRSIRRAPREAIPSPRSRRARLILLGAGLGAGLLCSGPAAPTCR